MEQIVDSEQLNTIGAIMKYVENKLMGKDLTLIEITDKIIEELNVEIPVEILMNPTMLIDSKKWLSVSKKQKDFRTKNISLNIFLAK